MFGAIIRRLSDRKRFPSPNPIINKARARNFEPEPKLEPESEARARARARTRYVDRVIAKTKQQNALFPAEAGFADSIADREQPDAMSENAARRKAGGLFGGGGDGGGIFPGGGGGGIFPS